MSYTEYGQKVKEYRIDEFLVFTFLSSKIKRFNDLSQLAQVAILPEIKFRIPDTQGVVNN